MSIIAPFLLLLLLAAIFWMVSFQAGLFFTTLATGGIWLYGIGFRPTIKSQPHWLFGFSRSLFPWFLGVFLIRALLLEPFVIPSSSMLPSLLPGDFILANKAAYGMRLPFTDIRLTRGDAPVAGDVILFRYPFDPDRVYIKRIIGAPGDVIDYQNKRVMRNGIALPQDLLKDVEEARIFHESIGGKSYAIRLLKEAPSEKPGCVTLGKGPVTVPMQHYFVLGDNRDESDDSRCWGFVPHANLIGKPLFVWFSWGAQGFVPERIGERLTRSRDKPRPKRRGLSRQMGQEIVPGEISSPCSHWSSIKPGTSNPCSHRGSHLVDCLKPMLTQG
jgi:signal peptidase I